MRPFVDPMRFAGIALRFCGRVPRIPAGPGKGLRFDGGPASDVFLSGRYELPVQEILSSLLAPGDVFFDIGANMGFFSVLAGRLIGPAGVIYAFEPVPANASMVEKNARLNHLANIRVVKVAASDRTGKGELLLAKYAGGAVLKSAGFPPDPAGSLTVETSRLDDLIRLREVRPPNVVKIDVEGAEMEVLRGMAETLRGWAPTLIMEVDDSDEGTCMKKLAECRSFVEQSGYRVDILPNSYTDGNWFVRHFVASHKET
jgi:FkbM family methyltransferase